jgi:hypothetical protein
MPNTFSLPTFASFSLKVLAVAALPAIAAAQHPTATVDASGSLAQTEAAADTATADRKVDAAGSIDVVENFALAQPFAARFDIQLDGKPMGYGEMNLQRLPDIEGRDDLQQFDVLFTSKATSGVAKLARFRGREQTTFVVQSGKV